MLSSNCDVVERKNNARQNAKKNPCPIIFLDGMVIKIMFPSIYIVRLLPPVVNVSSFFRTQSQVSIMASASGLAAVQQGSELQTASRDAGPRAPAS